MTTITDYRDFAFDCLRWTEQAKDASERETLIGIARLWLNVATRLDRHIALASDSGVIRRELRAKLD